MLPYEWSIVHFWIICWNLSDWRLPDALCDRRDILRFTSQLIIFHHVSYCHACKRCQGTCLILGVPGHINGLGGFNLQTVENGQHLVPAQVIRPAQCGLLMWSKLSLSRFLQSWTITHDTSYGAQRCTVSTVVRSGSLHAETCRSPKDGGKHVSWL